MYNKSACAIQTFKICNGKIKVKTYSADYAPDAVYSETSDALGGKYATCFAHNGRDNDFCLIKYNPQGDMEWNKIYDSGGNDTPNNISFDEQGRVVIDCYSDDKGFHVIKYDADGNLK